MFKDTPFNIVSNLDNVKHVDYFKFIMSLPGIYFNQNQTFPKLVHYIKPSKEIDLIWKDRLQKLKKPVIALNWQGDRSFMFDKTRSIALSNFKNILKLEKYAFISLQISSSFMIFFSLFSFILAWTFISLQIKEFRIMGLSINDSVYSCVFFFLTGLHFFHLVVGLLLLSLLSWSSTFPSHVYTFINLRTPEKKTSQVLGILSPLLSTASFSKYKLLIKRKRRLTKWRRFHGKESSPLEAIRELG